MSTKTLRKRIALATVAALGAGVLSLVSTTASFAVNTGSVSGDIDSTDTLATVTAGSTGLLGTSSNFLTAGNTTKTATLLSSGSLVLTLQRSSYMVVSSGAYISAATTAASISSDQQKYTAGSGADTDTITIKPTGAAGTTFTVSGYTDNTKATLTSLVTVTIAGSSVAGIPDASKSYVSWVATSTTGDAATADASGANATTAGQPLALQIDLNDVYGNAITSAGALTVTASTGANVAVAVSTTAASAITSGTYSTAVYGSSPHVSGTSGVNARVTEATAGAGWSGTVTVSYNGTVIATKSGVITGYISKITLANHKVSALTGDTTDAIRFTAVDAAGNCVATSNNGVSFIKNATSSTSVVSGLVGATDEVCAAGATAHTSGKITVTGGGTGGKSDVSVKYVRPDGAVITSNTVTTLVGGAAASYTASLDKNSYTPGDIATLTIQFKDSNGNAANSASTIETGADYTKATDLAISTPQLTVVGAYATGVTGGNDGRDFPDSNGQVSYTYSVGSTDGTYSASVAFPTVSTGTAQTVKYSVASGSTSLNDVLKGIVALIASINKQIAALAKLVAPAKKK